MMDYANLQRHDHIITVEDPIEFVHRSQNCLVQHREVGVHTRSFASALRGALREDPDILLVGEMRDLGDDRARADRRRHRSPCFRNAAHFQRVQSGRPHHRRFPDATSKTRSARPSRNRSKASSRKIFSSGSTNRAASPRFEILVVDMAIANLVREGKTHQIPGMIQVGKKKGNQPLDDAIMDHLRHTRISPEEAYDKAIDKKKFRPFLKDPPADGSEE